MAGGLVLRLELNSQTSQFKRRNKSSESLIKVFWPADARPKDLSMAVQIMANLARLTQHVLLGIDSARMNFISKWFDKTQLVFIQFAETLSFLEEGAEKYALLLPPRPEQVLSVNYNLPPAYTFFILRGSFKAIH